MTAVGDDPKGSQPASPADAPEPLGEALQSSLETARPPDGRQTPPLEGALTTLAEPDGDAEVTMQSQQRLASLPFGAPPDALLGLVLPGQFRVLRVLGEGGFGTVYLAEQVGVDRLAVIKVVRPELVASAGLLARFDREAKVLASLGHHHLVQLYVADRLPNGQPFLAMEYGGDRTLQDEIKRGGRLPTARALLITEQICDALEEAHSHAPKVIHRDLKPANVMLAEKSGRDWVKVVDVGMARLLGPGDSLDETLVTARGALMGTPAYFSPEQARGDPADERSDLYALGCVLFEMLSGRLPYEARSTPQFIHAHCYEAPLPLEEVGVQVPDAVRRVIYRALEKEPADRFQTAAEMRSAAHAARMALSDAPARADTPEPSVVPPSRRSGGPRPAEPHSRPAEPRPPAPAPGAGGKRLALGAAALCAAAAAVWFFALREPGSEDLALAREAIAAKDFKAALVFARRAGKPGAALAQRALPEADAQDIHEKLAAALDAKDADLALDLSKRCRAPGSWFCGQVEQRQGEVRALYLKAHLAAAAEQQAKGSLAACAAEAGLALAVEPGDAAARKLSETCAAVPPAAPAATVAAAPLPAAVPSTPAPAVAAAPLKSAAPRPDADAAATKLINEALALAGAGDVNASAERLLAAEALRPGDKLKLRIYKNLIVVSARGGNLPRACRYVALYRRAAPPGEQVGMERFKDVCASSGAAR